MDNKQIYLDNMASTPVDPLVLEEMLPYLSDPNLAGNPHSQHVFGERANNAISSSQKRIADAINARENEIIFTTGATESNNLAIKGAALFYQGKGKHIISCKTEHKSVLEPLAWLVEQGFKVTYLETKPDGLVDVDSLLNAITKETILISIMHVNNEIGVIQPIKEIGKIAKEHGILLHVDAAQSIGKTAIDVQELNVSIMSFSGHKVYGPMGIGALYINSKPKVRLLAQIHGGGQQRGIRSGTVAVPLVVGLGKAFELVSTNMQQELLNIKELTDTIKDRLENIPGIVIHGSLEHRIPHNLNFSVQGVDIESLLFSLKDIALSTASACVTNTQEGSYVLRALGVDDIIAQSAIRLSVGRFTTKQEVVDFLTLFEKQVIRLRQISGWRE